MASCARLLLYLGPSIDLLGLDTVLRRCRDAFAEFRADSSLPLSASLADANHDDDDGDDVGSELDRSAIPAARDATATTLGGLDEEAIILLVLG